VFSIVLLIPVSWGLYKVSKSRTDYLLSLFVIIAAFFIQLERYFYGCVSDPYSFFGLFHFNLADLVISLGVLTLAFRLVIKPLLSNK